MVTLQAELTVFVIDGDAARRDETALLLGREGIRFHLFPNAAAFLALANADTAGCVIADWGRPTPGEAVGAEFIRRLRQRDLPVPMFFTGTPASVAEVRQAFRLGATDFLFAPVTSDALLGAVEEAFASERKRIAMRRKAKQRDSLFNMLTQREREVASLAAQGHDNQLIGQRLGISHRTVEVHKSRVMRKLGARSLADLIRLGGQAQK